MASRKPLVIVSGEIEQLQAGDTLSATITEIEVLQQTATPDTIAGQAVYTDGNDSFDLARANASGTSKVLGLAVADIGNGTTGSVQTSGVLALTTGQWDAVAGTSGGLTANTDYYLSAATAGMLTATAPSTTGQYVVYVGRAISTTELVIDISRRILL